MNKDLILHRLIVLRCLTLFIWGICLILILSCKGGYKNDSKTSITRPNIIFFTVDTLRADHLRLYGYPRETMPTVSAFAKSALIFDNAVVPRGSTRPSYASMLTGLYPFHHGVRSNGAVLHNDITTLPEILRKNGYHTAAFVSNFVLISELSGLSQGFDVYDDRLDDRGRDQPNIERIAAHTLNAIMEWLATEPPQPFFLFINVIDPHGPYDPPDKFRGLYPTKKQRNLTMTQIPKSQLYEGITNFYDYVNRYDAEIRYVDEIFAALVYELKNRNLWDSSLFVFTADHGESMGGT